MNLGKFIFWGGFIFLLFLVWQAFFSVDVAILTTHYPKVNYDKVKEKRWVEFVSNRPAGWVSYTSISPFARMAVVSIEDSHFYQHDGVDVEQMKAAIQESIEEGRFTRGASTITQQMVKNVFLSPKKTLWRKFREIILTKRVEKILRKRQILEIYFNVVEWGVGVYGIKNAAWFYFHKLPKDLTLREASFLTIILPNPKKYSLSFRRGELTKFASRRMKVVFKRLFRSGAITQEQMQQALNERFWWE